MVYGSQGPRGKRKGDVFWAAEEIPLGANYLMRGDKVEYDVVSNKSKPGTMRALNISGGTGPEKTSLSDEQAHD
jgi:cold shock CspA family protein